MLMIYKQIENQYTTLYGNKTIEKKTKEKM